MNKKGVEISPPSLVVVIILVLLVLVVLLFIFADQSSTFINWIRGASKDITNQNKCTSAWLSRGCEGEITCSEGYTERDVPLPPTEEWSDCNRCVECVPEGS